MIHLAQALSKKPGLFLFLRRGVSGAKESVENPRSLKGSYYFYFLFFSLALMMMIARFTAWTLIAS